MRQGHEHGRKSVILAMLFAGAAGTAALSAGAPRADGPQPAPPRAESSYRPVNLSQLELARLAGRRVKLPASLRLGRERDLAKLVGLVGEGREASVRNAWRKMLLGLSPKRRGDEAERLTRWVLAEAYRTPVQEVAEQRARASYLSRMQRLMRDHLDKARAERVRAGTDQDRIAVETDSRVLSRVRYRRGAVPALHLKRTRMTPYELARYVQREEDRFRKLSADAEAARLQLSNAEQRMQQAYQTLSAMCKAMNDTAESVVRNIR